MTIKCATKDCKWCSAGDQCGNEGLVNKVKTGAVSSTQCSGKGCHGYQGKG